MKASIVIIILLFFGCSNSKEAISNLGEIQIVILKGTSEEQVLNFSKEVISKIESNDSNVLILFTDDFVRKIDSMTYLGAVFFEMNFYDNEKKLELSIHSFSSVSSINNSKREEPFIYYNKEKTTYFPENKIVVNQRYFE
jgi:hypothetical protein